MDTLYKPISTVFLTKWICDDESIHNKRLNYCDSLIYQCYLVVTEYFWEELMNFKAEVDTALGILLLNLKWPFLFFHLLFQNANNNCLRSYEKSLSQFSFLSKNMIFCLSHLHAYIKAFKGALSESFSKISPASLNKNQIIFRRCFDYESSLLNQKLLSY